MDHGSGLNALIQLRRVRFITKHYVLVFIALR